MHPRQERAGSKCFGVTRLCHLDQKPNEVLVAARPVESWVSELHRLPLTHVHEEVRLRVRLPHSCVGGESWLGQRAADDCQISSDPRQLLFRRRSQAHGLRRDDAVELEQELANRQYATIFRGAKCLGQVKGVMREMPCARCPCCQFRPATASLYSVDRELALPLRGQLVTLVPVLHVRKQQLHRRVLGSFSK